VSNNQQKLVASRVCGHCGRPLSRSLCEEKYQSVGVCPICELNRLELMGRMEEKAPTAAIAAFLILVIGFWAVLVLWLARINGVL
jgi:hypothetical protein